MRYALGATYLGDGHTRFVVWAPGAAEVKVRVLSPADKTLPLRREAKGYHQAIVEGIEPGCRYLYQLDGSLERPDPASRFQPDGVHGPSQVVNPDFPWQDGAWHGLPLRDLIIYELHAGAFTAEGTFAAIIPHLDELKDLGITAVELMPIAQFPGTRNWGYDGVCPYAVQDSYGGPEGLKQLVDACHRRGLAVILDVVYNHLGPEGNYLADFASYFTERYRTPWGKALNFDGPHSDEVRQYFIENALFWLTDYHIDALRLDAVHAILDHSPYTFLEELADAVHDRARQLNRRLHLIPESAANDSRLIRDRALGGYGLDAQWNDDFHHSIHTLLTGEQTGYYRDYGSMRHLEKAYREGFAYSGQYSPYRQRRHGTSSRDIPAERFVVFVQNHDQVGNRMLGDRLSTLVSFDSLKLAAGLVLLSPFVPLIFMGEEYGEKAPFPYFVSHSDPKLVDAVREGRREEFAAFDWKNELPDPQDEATFLEAKLDHDLSRQGNHSILRQFYRELIRIRRETPALSNLSKDEMEVSACERTGTLFVFRWSSLNEAAMLFNLSEQPISRDIPLTSGDWHRLLDSGEDRWEGKGSTVPPCVTSRGYVSLRLQARTFAVLTRSKEV